MAVFDRHTIFLTERLLNWLGNECAFWAYINPNWIENNELRLWFGYIVNSETFITYSVRGNVTDDGKGVGNLSRFSDLTMDARVNPDGDFRFRLYSTNPHVNGDTEIVNAAMDALKPIVTKEFQLNETHWGDLTTYIYTRGNLTKTPLIPPLLRDTVINYANKKTRFNAFIDKTIETVWGSKYRVRMWWISNGQLKIRVQGFWGDEIFNFVEQRFFCPYDGNRFFIVEPDGAVHEIHIAEVRRDGTITEFFTIPIEKGVVVLA